MARTRDLVRELKRVGDALAKSPGVTQQARERWVLASTEIMRDAVTPPPETFVDYAEQRARRCIGIAEAEGFPDADAIEARAVVLMNYKDSELDALEIAARAGLSVARRDGSGTL